MSSETLRAPSRTGIFLISLTGGIGVALSVICIPFVSPALRRICLPYVPATSQQVENVLQALRGRTGRLIDLGSGDGRLVFAAASNGFQACGVELNPWLVMYSRLSAYFQGLSPKTEFHRRDLLKFDLSSYDNVIIFGVPQMMEEIERKFIAELKNDSAIIACRFPLPNLKPIQTIGQGVDTVWIYERPRKIENLLD
ncbi:protein N-lysine methyltransferase FAM173B [Diachasma alloeum]|uniref:protein N-lysine methyltransferase FAM173B n=1 Tax=Diachasma alloeum TaxID=454923 RepID=UPI00073836DA|nr:protein N-lysine methyltransferase FAM173B [Diachasma alloeum]